MLRLHKTKLSLTITMFSAVLFVIVIAIIGGSEKIDDGQAATATINGASQAVCSPSPCSPGTVPDSTTNVVNLGTINNGSADQTRTYGYYIPNNLVHDGSASGKPAAVFDLSRTGCGTGGANGEYLNSQMGPVADANRFIIIELECASGTINWMHPETDCGGANGVNGGGICDASTAPSDEPYIKAAVADATTRFHLDSLRRYLVGGSSGANMTRDAICSKSTTPHNSTLFRGIMTMGGGANALLNTKSGVCPSGDKTTFWLEIMGTANQSDPYNTLNIPQGCTNNCDHTILGFDDTRNWWSNYLGNCSSPVHSTTGSGVLSDIYNYSCNDGNSMSPFFEAASVTNGGHMWCRLDSKPAANCQPMYGVTSNNTGGWSTAAFTWNFFAQGTSSTGTPPPPPPAPTVSISANPTSITSGKTSTLSWSSTNATSCSASANPSTGSWSGSKSTSGSVTVTPTATTTFSLTCSGSGGSASANAVVTVSSSSTPPPPPASPPPTGSTTVSLGQSGSAPTVSGKISIATGGQSASCNVDGKQVSCSDIDTTKLADGKHTIEAQIKGSDGRITTQKKTIIVNNHQSLLKNLRLRYGTAATVAMLGGGSLASVLLMIVAAWLLIFRRRPQLLHEMIAHAHFLQHHDDSAVSAPNPERLPMPPPNPSQPGSVVKPDNKPPQR